MYDSLAHAEDVAKHFSDKYGEDTWVVTVDTKHLARGPVFRAVDLLRDREEGVNVDKEKERGGEWLHKGEYLVMYRIPAQAIRGQTPVAWGENQKWRTVGVIGGA